MLNKIAPDAVKEATNANFIPSSQVKRMTTQAVHRATHHDRRPGIGDANMLTNSQRHWGVNQWTAWLKDKDIPILPGSQDALENLSGEEAGQVSPRELTTVLMADPLFALRLLRLAEQIRSHHLDHDTTTMLATILQIGVRRLTETAMAAELADISRPGFVECVTRATLATRIAYQWAAHHADVSPDEVAFAALLSETGELLLWAFVPELPEAALEALHLGQATRNAEAQEMTAGFSFRTLTLTLTEAWHLPSLITQLIKGSDTLRANIARIAIDTARHLHADHRNPAIPDDIRAIHEILPGVPHGLLLAPLHLDEAFQESVIACLAKADAV